MFPCGEDFREATGEGGGKLRLTRCLFYEDDYQIPPPGVEEELLSIWDALMQISHTYYRCCAYI